MFILEALERLDEISKRHPYLWLIVIGLQMAAVAAYLHFGTVDAERYY